MLESGFNLHKGFGIGATLAARHSRLEMTKRLLELDYKWVSHTTIKEAANNSHEAIVYILYDYFHSVGNPYPQGQNRNVDHFMRPRIDKLTQEALIFSYRFEKFKKLGLPSPVTNNTNSMSLEDPILEIGESVADVALHLHLQRTRGDAKSASQKK